MRAKLFLAPFIALALGLCPFMAETALASRPNGEHSCCPASKSRRDSKSTVPVKGDCCLRAPARGQVALAQPQLQLSFGWIVPTQPRFAAQHSAVAAPSDLSPPYASRPRLNASPRSPPLPA